MYSNKFYHQRRRYTRPKPSVARRVCFCARYFCFGSGVTILVSYLLFGSIVGHVVKNYDSQVTVLTIRKKSTTSEPSSSETIVIVPDHVANQEEAATVSASVGLEDLSGSLQKALTDGLREIGENVQTISADLVQGALHHEDAAQDDDDDHEDSDSIHKFASNLQNVISHMKDSLNENLSEGLQQVHIVSEHLSGDMRESVQNLAGGLQELGEDMQDYDAPHINGKSHPHPHVVQVAVDWSALSDEDLVHHFAAAGDTVHKGRIAATVQNTDNPIGESEEAIEFYWQLPDGTLTDSSNSNTNLRGGKNVLRLPSPRAILFLAHACRLSAEDWFSSLSGPAAPEEQAIVKIAREKGLMVLSMSSSNQNTKCWDGNDAPRVAKLLLSVKERTRKLFAGRQVPIFAFGSDTGATMLTTHLLESVHEKDESPPAKKEARKTTNLALDGIIAENIGARLNPEIPVVYITLPDEEREHKELDQALEDHTGMTEHIELPKLTLTPTLLYERLPSLLTQNQSIALFNMIAHEDNDMLDSNHEGFKHHPRHDPTMKRILQRFGKTLQKDDDLDGTMIADKIDAIVEVFMVVWGRGATTRDGVDQGVDWLLKLLSIPAA